MVSVIVPVYNAEEYLQEAIDSVFMQTYHDWELILVDDGSADGSSCICKEAAEKSEKVRMIRQENSGLSGARNTGISNSKGAYITFLDADDRLTPTALEVLIEKAEKYDADIVCGRILEFTNSFSKTTATNNKDNSFRIYTSEEAVRRMLYQKDINNSPCGKLFSRRLWDNLHFRAGTWYEDLDIIPIVFLDTDKIISLSNPVYLYRQHPASFIHTFSLRRGDVIEVTQRLTLFMEEKYPALTRAARSRQLSACFNILTLIAANYASLSDEKNAGKESEEFKAMLLADTCWNKIKELRGEALRNPSVRLKNKLAILLSYIGGRKIIESFARVLYRH